MLRFNYFYVIVSTNDNLKHQCPDANELFPENPFTSFLVEIARTFYYESFCFEESMLIRTMNTQASVLSNINHIKDKSSRRQNYINIDFEVHDAFYGDFMHPEDEAVRIDVIELYTYFAKKHFANTGIDFLAGYDHPGKLEKIEIVKSVIPDTTIRSKIQKLKGKIIQIQFEDGVRKIPYNDENFNRVELIKTLTEKGTSSCILIYQKEGAIITLNYKHENIIAEDDFTILQNIISPELPF